MTSYYDDTIAAVATAAGKAGVGIVRVSGPAVLDIARQILGFSPKNRHAHYCPFLDAQGNQLDQGIVIFFPGPHSFTGENVLELQAHGGPVVLDMVLKAVLDAGARLAHPGEFSQRAFLNNKLDLVQAEAIADLINSESRQACECAMRSLQGAFSEAVDNLVQQLINLRVYVEASIDFPEEEVDFLSDGKVQRQLEAIISQLNEVMKKANQGTLITEGMNVVIAGRPNAGKSSLLNALSGRDAAIVTSVEGTTRDVLKESIHIDGMPLHIIDTAGLRDSVDEVEKIGIDRAWQQINQADRILLVIDANQMEEHNLELFWPEFTNRLQRTDHLTIVLNKIDLKGEEPAIGTLAGNPVISLSAKQDMGLDLLRNHLKDCMGFDNSVEGGFTARRRHLEALDRARHDLDVGYRQLTEAGAGELLAEDLRLAQEALGEITGTFSSDDLLGEIFSSFCIGK